MNYRNYYKEKSEAASERAKKGWVSRHAAMVEREPTFEDLVYQAKRNRRGEVFATLQTINHQSGRVTRIVLHHSDVGRSDQFQVTVNGRVMARPMGITEIFKRWKTSIIDGAKMPVLD